MKMTTDLWKLQSFVQEDGRSKNTSQITVKEYNSGYVFKFFALLHLFLDGVRDSGSGSMHNQADPNGRSHLVHFRQRVFIVNVLVRSLHPGMSVPVRCNMLSLGAPRRPERSY